MFLHVLIGQPFSDHRERIQPMEISVDAVTQAPAFAAKIIMIRIQGVEKFISLISFCTYL